MQTIFDEKALDAHLKTVVRQVFLEEYADRASVTPKQLHEMVRMMVQQRGFNRKEAAKYIGKSPSTVDRLYDSGQLAKTVNGTLTYYRKEDLDEWLDSGITAKKYIRRRRHV